MTEFPRDEFVVDLAERTVLHKPSGIWFSFYEYNNEQDWKQSDSVTYRDNPSFTGDRMKLAAAAKEAAIAEGMTAQRPNQNQKGRRH